MLQPIQLISSNIEVAKAGKIPGGKTEIPFEFPLHTKGNKVLYETYHGVFVNIQVSVKNMVYVRDFLLLSGQQCSLFGPDKRKKNIRFYSSGPSKQTFNAVTGQLEGKYHASSSA